MINTVYGSRQLPNFRGGTTVLDASRSKRPSALVEKTVNDLGQEVCEMVSAFWSYVEEHLKAIGKVVSR